MLRYQSLLPYRFLALSALLAVTTIGCDSDADPTGPGPSENDRSEHPSSLDRELRAALAAQGFTGRIGSTLTARLGRPVDPRLADLGRLLWFDPITGLNDDNACAGCHSPTNGFGDTQSIAIGIENNGIVGPDRRGPRNQRRSPMVINSAFRPDPDVELTVRGAVG